MKILRKRYLFFVILTIFSLIRWIDWSFTQEEVTNQILPPPGNFIEIDGLKIHYLKEGEGKENIILIHGFAASSFSFRHCMKTLSSNFTVYAIDLIGFGYSDKPVNFEYGIDTFADLIIKFMDSLNIKSATLAGNSMGGAVSIKVALKYPPRVQRLILIDSAGLEEGIVSFVKLLKIRGDEVPFVNFVREMLKSDFLINSILKMVFYNHSLITEEVFVGYANPLRSEGAAEALIEMTKRFKGLNYKEYLSSLNIPTLIIWGEQDRILPVKSAYDFKEEIKRSELLVIPNCGHIPMEEFPEEVNKAVINFVKKTSSFKMPH